jgi:hypothetical protein
MFWEELIVYFPFIWNRPNRERCVQQFCCCCTCICCHSNGFTKLLPSSDRGLYMQTHRLMGGMCELCHWDDLRCHDIHTKFHKDWFSHSEVNRRDSYAHRQQGNLISLLLVFQNKESRLKIECKPLDTLKESRTVRKGPKDKFKIDIRKHNFNIHMTHLTVPDYSRSN